MLARARQEANLLFSLLGPERTRRFWLLLIPMTMVALIEFCSVGLFLPYISLISNPTSLGRPGSLHLYYLTGASDLRSFIVRSGLLIALFFVFRTWFCFRTTQLQHKFASELRSYLAGRLLEAYFRQPYTFFLTRNKSVLQERVVLECERIGASLVDPILGVMTEFLVLVALMALLFFVDPTICITTVIIVGGVFIFSFIVVRPFVNAYSKEFNEGNEEVLRTAGQALSGVKTIKALGAEQIFVSSFKRQAVRVARCYASYVTLATLPRLTTELAAVAAIVGVMIVAALNPHKDLATLLPELTVYGAAAFRIMPSGHRIFGQAMAVRYYWPSIQKVAEGLHGDLAPPEFVPEPMEPVRQGLELQNVSFRYPESAGPTVQGLSVVIPAGSRVAFVGSSGAGKSTLVDLVLGLLHPESGRILVDGEELTPARVRAWQDQIGYVPQDVFLADTTLARNISLGTVSADSDRMSEAVERAQLGPLVRSLPLGLDTPAGELGVRLSGGERQRMGLARALYRRPSVLVLDEATSALDGATERDILDHLEQLPGVTQITITHRLRTLENYDRLFLLEGGRLIAQGTFQELLETRPEFARLVEPRQEPVGAAGT